MFKRLFRLSGFKVALLVSLGMLVLFFLSTGRHQGNFLTLMDKQWVDFTIKGRGLQPHDNRVVIATIDTLAVNQYGRWPWPRERMAQMVETLTDYYNVSIIGFDVVFSEPDEAPGKAIQVTDNYKQRFRELGLNGSSNAQRFVGFLDQTASELDGDTKFGEALSESPNTVLGYFFFADPATRDQHTQEELETTAARIEGSQISLIFNTISDSAIHEGLVVESNTEKISRGSGLKGFFNMQPDPEDGTVRRVHLLMRYGDDIYPSLDLQMLRLYYGNPPIAVVATAETGEIQEIQIGDPNNGGKLIVPNADGSVMLNYKGPASTFAHLSIYDIIERNIPKEELEGKIVLVGATEVGIYDLRTTPVGVAYPGVEVHATLLDNLLTDTYFQYHDYLAMLTALLILAIGILLGVALPHLKHIYGTLLTIAILVGYTVAHRYMVMELLSWTSFVFVMLVTIAVWGAITLFRFLVSDRDQRFIKGAFRQYLSPDVINQLTENPDLLKLGGELRVMTAFFSDVQSFSSISEKLTPEQLVALLNVYLTEMSNIIMRYGGTVDKYEGDAIIAFFGAPVPYEDHATRAALVTLECHATLSRLNDEWYKSGLYKTWEEAVGPRLKHRIGLNTGEMIVGNMGSENRFDYTMMGNSVNLAARLEGACKNYKIYTCVSEYTWEPAKDAIVGREMDLIRVMGIRKPVRIYEVFAQKGQASDDVVKAMAIFEKGLELYRQQQWDEAITHFQAVMKIIPDDPPSGIFIGRCQDYKDAAADPKLALPQDWDGVFVASSK